MREMHLKLGEIADRLAGLLDGSGDIEIHGVASIGEAAPGQITFLANPRYAAQAAVTKASAIIVGREFPGKTPAATVRVADPYLGFLKVLRMFQPGPARPKAGIHPTAVVDASVHMGDGVAVGALCVVEAGTVLGDRVVLCPGTFVGAKTVLGKDTYIHANVTLRERVTLGERVIVHSGTVIGSDGFGYTRGESGHEKIPQVGTVVIGDDVEIGANVTIDRGTLDATRIGNGVKVDNLVHVGHNVSVGDNTLVIAQVGISGSTKIGRDVILAGQAGLVGHITIGDGAVVGAQAGVTKSVPAGLRVSGYPAMEHERSRRLHALTRRLPLLSDAVRDLETRVKQLESALDASVEGAGERGRRRNGRSKAGE